MANLKLIIVKSKKTKSGVCSVMLQLSAKHKTLRIPTEINVKPELFIKGVVHKDDPDAKIKNIKLAQIVNDHNLKIINNPLEVAKMDVYALKRFLFPALDKTDIDFFQYCQNQLTKFKADGRHNSARILKSTHDKLKKFWGRNTLDFAEINQRFLEQFAKYCSANMTTNGIASYLRYFRYVINQAIDDELMTVYPFRKFKIKTEKTRNRNLSAELIRKIRDYEPKTKREEITRDTFLIQLYCLGINIKDLFYLKHSQLIKGRLQFNRSKTDRFYNIKIEPEALTLIEKYKGEKYLLWFADHCSVERKAKRKAHSRQSHFQYANESAFSKMLNSNLEDIHDNLKLNLPNKPTTYYVRHSVASIMRDIDISKDDISLCLGHSNPDMKVTGIYINEDFEKVDIANRELINFLNSKCKDGNRWKAHKEEKKISKTLKFKDLNLMKN